MTPASVTPPVLVAGFRGAVMLAPDGAASEMAHAEAVEAIAAMAPPIVCHGPATARRLGIGPFPALDILELFAFVRPAEPCLPTIGGIADALGLARPGSLEDAEVFHTIEDECYENLLAQQVTDAKAAKGEGDLAKLFNSGDTWTVE